MPRGLTRAAGLLVVCAIAACDGGKTTSPPEGARPARRILDPSATLTGGGDGTCTHQVPASGNGERWCVFTRPGSAGRTELWALNATRAAAKVPACGGSEAGCVRLSDNVWMGGGLNGPFQPYANRFFGDTLVFYADALSGLLEVHRGPAFAWRPGWARPRRIGSDTTLEYWGHSEVPVAHCIGALAGDPERPDSFELRAGPIADRDDLELPSLGRVVPRDNDGALAWQAGFSPRGDVFVVSQPDPTTHVESLAVVATDRIGLAPPTPILAFAQRWLVSHDGSRVFFVRAKSPEEVGLFSADFPTGARVTPIEGNITDYFLLEGAGLDRGVGFLAHLGPESGALRLATDPSMPAAARTVFQFDRGLDAFRLSRDMRFTAWRDPDFAVNLVRHDTLETCLLNATPGRSAYSVSFLEHAGLVFWTESDGSDRDRRDGHFANPLGCQGKTRFAQAVYFLMPIGDRGLVFADEINDDTQRTNLKYAALTKSGGGGPAWPAEGPVRIHDQIDGTSVRFVGADPLLLLFTVSTGPSEQQGTFLFGPVPF